MRKTYKSEIQDLSYLMPTIGEEESILRNANAA